MNSERHRCATVAPPDPSKICTFITEIVASALRLRCVCYHTPVRTSHGQVKPKSPAFETHFVIFESLVALVEAVVSCRRNIIFECRREASMQNWFLFPYPFFCRRFWHDNFLALNMFCARGPSREPSENPPRTPREPPETPLFLKSFQAAPRDTFSQCRVSDLCGPVRTSHGQKSSL